MWGRPLGPTFGEAHLFRNVVITWDETDIGGSALSGSVGFQISANVVDTASGQVARSAPPLSFPFMGGSGSSEPLVANDSAGISPAGTW
jgi:hypothetical protein